jgi:hypothetical protein
MGLVNKSKKVKQKLEAIEQDQKTELIRLRSATKHNLTKSEIQFLLKLIGQSAFQGKDVQVIYDITAKLQNQYTG